MTYNDDLVRIEVSILASDKQLLEACGIDVPTFIQKLIEQYYYAHQSEEELSKLTREEWLKRDLAKKEAEVFLLKAKLAIIQHKREV